MRFTLLFAFLALFLGCTPPSAPAAVAHEIRQASIEGAATLANKTVALVADVEGEPRAYCSGVWVGDDKILTALHCVEDAELGEAIEYVVHDDVYEAGSALERSPIRTRRAFLLAVDPGHDMALLRAPAYPKGHPVALTALTPVLQGARTQAMGQSLGLWWSYSTGDVAAIRQTEINGMDILWVQTTAATSPGNSGGGLFDEVGQLIGLCHATAVRGQNVNFYVHKVYIDSFLRAAGA